MTPLFHFQLNYKSFLIRVNLLLFVLEELYALR